MHCGRVSNLVSAYIDRELAGVEMLQIRRHLDGCPGCSTEYEALVRVKSLLSAAPPAEPTGDVVAAVMRRYAERKSQRPPAAPRWRWHWKWSWQYPAHGRQRLGLALTSACLALVVAGTAAALRKPNYPDALAANIWPELNLKRQEETLPPPSIRAETIARILGEQMRGRGESTGGGVGAMLVSDRLYWGSER